MTDAQETQQGKVPVNYDQLCGLADHARRVGTLDAFADVALQWAGLAEKEIDRLTAERDALKADAERYRWLRGDSCPDHSSRWTHWEVRCWKAPSWTGDLRRADLDDAIDAAKERA